jgi:neutral ceramidase
MAGEVLAHFRKADITPGYPVRLAGYFNERISTGVLDPLHMRLAVLKRGDRHLVFIQVDNCAIKTEDTDEIRRAIATRTAFQKHEIMLFTSHIHTGPDLVGFFGLQRDEHYLEELKTRIVEEAAALNPCERSFISIAQTTYEGLAFNRRWFMKDGTVVTNPPKKSPERREPEGAVDRAANSIIFKNERGRLQALFVNISNHTDSIGGNQISADWPGIIESHLNDRLETRIPVFPFLAPQGNINHLEFEDLRPQSSYDEAKKLGQAYAEIIARSLSASKAIDPEKLRGNEAKFEANEIILSIPSREISMAELEEARKILDRAGEADKNAAKDLTAEDLAKGDPAVEQLFARELVRFAETKPSDYNLPLQAFKLANIAFAAIPGEPFVEIGLALKTIPGYDLVFPVALANGYFGYIPLKENVGRGGYEVRPGAASQLSTDAADRILSAFRAILAGTP